MNVLISTCFVSFYFHFWPADSGLPMLSTPERVFRGCRVPTPSLHTNVGTKASSTVKKQDKNRESSPGVLRRCPQTNSHTHAHTHTHTHRMWKGGGVSLPSSVGQTHIPALPSLQGTFWPGPTDRPMNIKYYVSG